MPKTKAEERFRDIMFNRNHDINTITYIYGYQGLLMPDNKGKITKNALLMKTQQHMPISNLRLFLKFTIISVRLYANKTLEVKVFLCLK